MPRADSADAVSAFLWLVASPRAIRGCQGKPDGPAPLNPSWPTFSRSRVKEPDAIRAGVRNALTDCEAIFRAQEPNKRMRDKAAHACRALCRARVVEELQLRWGRAGLDVKQDA
jgi:hypothetical protein